MNGPALRARSIGEILDLSFQLYRRQMVPMIMATGVLLIPILVLQLVADVQYLLLMDRLSQIFFLAASAAVVVIASEGYMGRELDGISALKRVNGRFLSVWGAAIMQGILVAIGTLLLIIPGLIFYAWTFGMQQAIMIEGNRAGDSFERSRDLARGHIMHVLLTAAVAFVITMIAALGAGTVGGLVFTGERSIAVFVTLVMIVLNPFAAVVNTVLYYDLRIRKEAFDVQVYTERMDEAVPVPG